jgi:hypothetical protein
MSLLVQLAGSALVLISFIGGQTGRLPSSSRAYLSLNAIGSLALLTSALIERQWGFMVLETSWFAVSTYNLIRAQIAAGHSAGPHEQAPEERSEFAPANQRQSDIRAGAI